MVSLLKRRVSALSRIDPVTRGWAVVTSAGVGRLGLGFVASLVIARALRPADFGVYAVLAASVFHFRELTIGQVKAAMAEEKITVRMTAR